MSSRIKIRVRFGDTDRMGVVYYGRFFDWFVEGMMDYYRSAGVPYLEMEKRGIRTAIVETRCRYKSPAYFDDVIEVNTHLQELRGKNIKFSHEIFNSETEKHLAAGYTVSVFLDERFNSTKPPEWLLEVFEGDV